MQTKNIEGKSFLVLGMGQTGKYTVNALTGHTGSIIAADTNTALDIRFDDPGISLYLGKDLNQDISLLSGIDMIVISPGISCDIPIIDEAENRGIKVVSEIELAYILMDDDQREKTIAVTGTNGKTTVVTLIDRFLNASGIRSIACGNIGLPLIGTLKDEDTIRVIEVSSFQLEKIFDFRPRVSVLLNITSDHIDRHKDFKSYLSTKYKVFANQKPDDTCILNIDDPNISEKVDQGFEKGPRAITFSTDSDKETDLNMSKGNIIYDIYGDRGIVDIKDVSLKGEHNASNIMAALAASRIFGADIKAIEKELKSIEKLEHRIEFLGSYSGVRCFNDSKSTNPDAASKALAGFKKEVILIAGGRDKDMDFSIMEKALRSHVKSVLLIGENKKKIQDFIKERKIGLKTMMLGSMEEAVDKAFMLADKGDVILLSPASASMDMFRDYKHRGEVFKKLVSKRKKDA